MTEPLSGVKNIVAVHSAKGGVGKSTLTVNLAAGLARKGAKVGLLDADIHGPSGTIMMGNAKWPDPGNDENTIQPLEAHGVKFISMGNLVTKQTPLVWRGAMVHSVIEQFFHNVLWGELDYLLVDMPPGTGDAQLSIAQGMPLTGAVIISTPQELSLVDSLRGIQTFRQLKVPILGLVENMSFFVCGDCGDRAFPFGESGAELMAEELEIPFLGSIPMQSEVCESGDRGVPFVVADPDSAAARALDGVQRQLMASLERHQPTRAFDIQWRPLGFLDRFPDPPDTDIGGDSPVRALWQVSADELGVHWREGDTTIFSVRALRLACPCAACVEEWTGEDLLDPTSVPQDITIKEIKSVGRYAVNPVFSDGHASGIYSFKRLKELAESSKAKAEKER